MIEVNGTYQCFQGIAKDLAHFQRAIHFVVQGDFFQPHANSNFIQLLAVHHFAAHFVKKTFFFVGISFEKIIGDQCTEYGITQVFKPFIIFIGSFPYGTMGKAVLYREILSGLETQNIFKLLFKR